MRRFLTAAVLAATALGTGACNTYDTGLPPTTPSGSSTPPPDAITINVVGINGAQSFSPNPATVPAGKFVVWHNVDTVTHRVVFNDGEVDTGNLSPGAFSSPTPLVAAGPYHCAIHPAMVGTTTDH